MGWRCAARINAEVQALVGKITDRKVITYGFNAQADVRCLNLQYKNGSAFFDVALQNEGHPNHGLPFADARRS